MVDRDASIQDTENVLRDLIQQVMSTHHGNAWVEHLGVTPERLALWKERRNDERKRRVGAVIDQRILWYADFTDLWTILKKNWIVFKPCFGDARRLEVYLDRLASLRNPGAHSRALLPFERTLVEGMTGELRQQVTLFMSSGAGGPEPEHFPRIEFVRDSFGHQLPGKRGQLVYYAPDISLRPGDEVVLSGSAWDPEGAPMNWHVGILDRPGLPTMRGTTFEYTWQVSEADISERLFWMIRISTNRSYHRLEGRWDDEVNLVYRVLPRR